MAFVGTRVGSRFFRLSFFALLLLLFLPPWPVVALPRYGPLDISGNVSAQNLFRSRDIDQWAFIQQRNTLKLRVDYKMIQNGKLVDRVRVPYIRRLNLHLLYRGVYDSVYDFTPGFEQRDIYGNEIRKAVVKNGTTVSEPLQLDDLTNRDAIKFENRLREAYVDVKLSDLPLSFRLGRQQIVWGETDNFRLLDRVNSLDLTWHLQQESWDEIRIPYWMIKGLWTIDWLDPLFDTFVEFYWNPGDWYPNKRVFLPRPWSLPVTNPTFVAAGAFNAIDPTLDVSTNLAENTRLFRNGDYHRNPEENSQFGIRFNAVTPQGIQFTLNYFYQRWSGGDDGTNAALISAVLNPERANFALDHQQLPVKAIYPYTHTVGFSLNYAENTYTQAVFRMENIYEFGVPFTNASKRYDPTNTAYNPLIPLLLGRDAFGVTKKDMWKGMIGFDRPTWIRSLNRRSTFFFTGQFFWHYLVDNESPRCVDPNESLPCPKSGQGKGLRGGFSQSAAFAALEGVMQGRPPVNPQGSFDRVRTWEVLTTLAVMTLYKGGSVVPFIAYVLDPVNNYNQEVFWSVDYFVTNDFIVNVGQRYFINTTSHPVFETWGVAGANRGRSETQVRFTYQF